MLDNISRGRLDITIGIGYVPSEFDMFGVAISDRARLVETKLDVLRRAFAGEHFEYCGRKIHVTPPLDLAHSQVTLGAIIRKGDVRVASEE